MAETLKIENFGPIKKANLKLGKTTVFIGEQSSGKSTIAKLIAILTDAWLISSIRYTESAPQEGFETSLRNFNIDGLIEAHTRIEYSHSEYKMLYYNGEFKLTITNTEWNKHDLVKTLHRYSKSNSKEDFSKIYEYYSSVFPEAKLNINSESWRFEAQLIISSLFYHLTNSIYFNLYIPTERIFVSTIHNQLEQLFSRDMFLSKSFLTFISAYKEAREELSKLKIEPLNVSFSHENGSDFVTDNGKKLLLNHTSSGIQSLVPLFLTVSRSSKIKSTYTRFLVEEPELSLFPSTQLKLINTLGEKCTKGGNQLVITTHSPYVLTALNNLLFAYKTASKKPDAKKKINKVIPEASWLNPDEFKAYYVGKGTVKSIIDKDNGLIGENHLDDASYDAKDTFYQLMQIYKD